MKSYAQKLLDPYIAKKREELDLTSDHPAVVIFDNKSMQK